MTRVYISGPITGYPNLNKDAFDYEERLLKEAGFEVFNPQSIEPPVREHWEKALSEVEVWRYYMKICVGQIPLCDEMRMLPHWQNSKGAVWEHNIAQMLGLEITYCPVTEVPKW